LRVWGIRIAVFLALSAVAFVATEVWLRSVTAHLIAQDDESFRKLYRFPSMGQITETTASGRRLIPGASVVLHNNRLSGKDVPIAINGAGFRNEELAQPRSRDELRILVLGDSITMGDYLLAEEVWVEQAQAHLQAALPDRAVDVINAGLSDLGLREEVDIFEERGLVIEPDMVVLAFYMNDSRPPWGFPGELGTPGWLRRNSLVVDAAYRALVLRDWLKEQGDERFAWVDATDTLDWRGDRDEFLELARRARFDWGSAWQQESWELVDAELARLTRLVDRLGVPLAIIAFPVSFQVEADLLEDGPQRALRLRAERLGHPFLDLLPTLRAGGDDQFFDHCHPREATNAVIGAAVADFLLKETPPLEIAPRG